MVLANPDRSLACTHEVRDIPLRGDQAFLLLVVALDQQYDAANELGRAVHLAGEHPRYYRGSV